MKDIPASGFDDRELDQVLSTAFPASPRLSGEFEDRVMSEVEAHDRAKLRHRKVARLMAVYWGIATTIMSSLLAGSSFTAQPAGIETVLVTLLVVLSGAGLAWYIARQSGVRLQSLFARTLL